ncbi:MAG: hypothetical protein HOP11_10340 [Saprospiraceae bacterium]|nr:hypothetical protein [Saprospiraceae bacterium]
MTPTIFSNGLLKAGFDQDTSYFLDRIESPLKLKQTLKIYKDLRPSMQEYENILMSDNMQHDRMRDSAIQMYKGLIDSIAKFGIKKMVFDTVDFNNYVNNYRPYYKLDAEGYIYQNNETYVLQIKEAILLMDGWNLGSVRLFKPTKDEMLLRVIDSLKEASKTDPRNIRVMDSLKKINYEVKENPFVQ